MDFHDGITFQCFELEGQDLVQCLPNHSALDPKKKQKKRLMDFHNGISCQRFEFGTVFTNIILLWIQIFFKFFFFKIFFFKIFFFLNFFFKIFFFKNFFFFKKFFFQKSQPLKGCYTFTTMAGLLNDLISSIMDQQID